MKLLCAIKSEGNHLTIADGTLRWAARAGYDLRIFVPKVELEPYQEALTDANYNWYLALSKDMLIPDTDPMTYAQVMGYDLLATLPDGMTDWRKRADMERQVFLYCEAIGKGRLQFAENPGKRVKHYANGATMERVRKL